MEGKSGKKPLNDGLFWVESSKKVWMFWRAEGQGNSLSGKRGECVVWSIEWLWDVPVESYVKTRSSTLRTDLICNRDILLLLQYRFQYMIPAKLADKTESPCFLCTVSHAHDGFWFRVEGLWLLLFQRSFSVSQPNRECRCRWLPLRIRYPIRKDRRDGRSKTLIIKKDGEKQTSPRQLLMSRYSISRVFWNVGYKVLGGISCAANPLLSSQISWFFIWLFSAHVFQQFRRCFGYGHCLR